MSCLTRWKNFSTMIFFILVNYAFFGALREISKFCWQICNSRTTYALTNIVVIWENWQCHMFCKVSIILLMPFYIFFIKCLHPEFYHRLLRKPSIIQTGLAGCPRVEPSWFAWFSYCWSVPICSTLGCLTRTNTPTTSEPHWRTAFCRGMRRYGLANYLSVGGFVLKYAIILTTSFLKSNLSVCV